jgi:magnesium transporter
MTSPAWRFLVNAGAPELAALREELAIPPDLLEHALDPGERPRIRTTPEVTFLLLRVPVALSDDSDAPFGTAPLAIIVTQRGGAVIAMRDDALVEKLRGWLAQTSFAVSAHRVVLTALELAAEAYLELLDVIDRRADAVEARLGRSLENREVLELLRYQRSLVYFSAALEAMYRLLERLQRKSTFHVTPEEEDWLDDVVVEFRQAVETTNLQRTVLSERMDAFASIISNNLNVVMKFLAAVTVILTVPMIVSSLYGMNVSLPAQHHPNAFTGTLVASLAFCIAIGAYFRRRGWL